ncbi:translation initiation factor IF-2 [Mucilaginibacter polytrichastri]|uniref:Translation initiation factor IF-2 n=1 Tax=Mucilaginibacter polytrichastri TaxID=1302689 RepID=A0A1Q6A521_9SPHI|nr:translation initiation factor IF-2 [Mucilaginibacter polytrichastri]OKS89111.1 Translation initiation factor IF-2 [Mucilaginibacter polytrichastri]SFS96665.1 translation initiation factor IF-2 [Mucilaginibacter polytrichastri]
MSEDKSIKLFKAAKELNIGIGTIVEFLGSKGFKVDKQPNYKLDSDMYTSLLKQFGADKIIKEEAKQINIGKIRRDEPGYVPEKGAEPHSPRSKDFEPEEILIKNAGQFSTPAPAEKPKAQPEPAADRNDGSLPGVKVVGKIDLNDLSGKNNRPEVKEEAPAAPEVKAQPEPKPVAEVVAPVKEVPATPAPEVVKPTPAPAPVAPPVAAEPEVVKPTPPPAAPVTPPVVAAAPIAETPAAQTPAPVVAAVVTPAPAAAAPEVQKPTPPPAAAPAPVAAAPVAPEDDVIRAKADRLSGPNIIGKIVLPVNPPKRGPVASSSNTNAADQRRKRKRKDTPPGQNPQQGQGNNNPQGQGQQGGPGNNQQRGPHPGNNNRPGGGFNNNRPGGNNTSRPPFGNRAATPSTGPKEEPTEKEIQDQIKATLARLSGAGKSGKFAQRAKFRRQKRDDVAANAEEDALEREAQSKVLKVTEFVTANELASMMDVGVTQIISTCMSLGLFVSINQRLDAETLTIVAEEFGYQIDFVKPEDEEWDLDEPDAPEDLIPRSPIVTIMGHVDHGKTSLLDFIRKTNVIGGEAGGITQHIGAYEVVLPEKGKITFLDTPGHEAFTAMRARGAQVTDIVIIVIAADDSVMPQTREAINHAQAAGAPIIFAFNKIDKPGANPDKVREQLSTMNILVEEWGGKYQTQEISAKSGLNVDLLLEKVLLEAELLELKANPNKRAVGTVIEAALDKGRGIVTTVLVQAGTLRVGDPILAGCYSGRVKALFNERGARIEEVGPSGPVQVLGMQGAPTAGDKFNALESEVVAREIANKRLQLQREQGLRTQKHITLDEIGRRLAIGNFKELNIIVKGDVDGSIEALSDSLLKQSTDQIQVNIISKGVGQISESDVLLASASDAIIIGFQVRPSASARKLAEAEQIDIRLYSIIYDAINEIKAAMEGMLAPTFEEKIVANVEIRETFKISKVGTIAGCMVLDGKITRNSKIRIVRDGVVIYTGELASLKRYKDDVKEVNAGYECGLNIQNFNNIEEGDIVEAYENVEVKRKVS